MTMKKEAPNLIRVFQQYGFEYRREYSDVNSLIFVIKQAFFDNAVIVRVKGFDSEEAAVSLKKLGYAVKEYEFTSIHAIEEILFDAFFSAKITRAGFLKSYDRYIARVLKSFPTEASVYSYISAPYSKNVGNDFLDSRDIIKDIIDETRGSEPKLILIEAAAGFGKTSTAFEIGKRISEDDAGKLVLFAELSRDRQAKIFKHVLYSELDRSFPSLPSGLVVDAIQKGRITVVLDGFDELLRSNEEENQFEKSEAMLETIGEILKGQSKVILTTRKTALLQGDEFHNWVESHDKDFSVVRYTLHEPEIGDWLTGEKIELLESSGINIKNIANPVLLTYLNYLPEADFIQIAGEPDIIVEKYFNSMLEREKERQELLMSTKDQINLLTRLAEDMIRKNYTKDTRENIIKHFLISESDVIEMQRQNYPAPSRPTRDELANRFANHALLDRSRSDEQIGFINDFSLGNFVSNSAICSVDPEWVADEIFIEAAITSYSPRSYDSRSRLWGKLSYSLQYIDEKDQIKLEAALLNVADLKVSGTNINNMQFDGASLFPTQSATECVFYECTFKDCEFNFLNISKNTFVCCHFYSCTSSDYENNNNQYISCHEDGGHILTSTSDDVSGDGDDEKDAKEFILEKFWPKGKDSITFAHRPLSLFYGKNNSGLSSAEIEAAMRELERSGLTIEAKRKNWIGIDTSRLNEISKILGRVQ